MVTLLSFIRVLFQYISSSIGGHRFLDAMISLFPKSMYSIRKLMKPVESFTVFVVCPKCSALYSPSECTVTIRNKTQSKLCDFVEYPKHKHVSRRTQCGEALMKQIHINGKCKFVPRKTFIYNSIISSLRNFVKRKSFLSKCELWRERVIPRNQMYDIYDGKIWKEFAFVSGEPFLSFPHNLCLTLNKDWFNPFKEMLYSAGAIYLVVQNLPRKERYKIDNVILVGITPGPKEPKNMNNYLNHWCHNLSNFIKVLKWTIHIL